MEKGITGANGLLVISGMATRLCQFDTRGLSLMIRQRRSVINNGFREL